MKAEISDLHRVWLLAGLLLFHGWLLIPGGGEFLLTGILPVAAIFLHRWRLHPPLLVASALGLLGGAFVVLQHYPSLILPGILALWLGGVQLLRPLTSLRGLAVLYCIVIVLAVVVLRPNPRISGVFLVLDVLLLFFAAQLLHQPPGAEKSFRQVFLRSLGLVIPVGLVVSAFFVIFPGLGADSGGRLAGFSATGVMNPGDVAALHFSSRVAFEARVGEGSDLPEAADLYWRGQVLEVNEGLRWKQGPAAGIGSANREEPAAVEPRWEISFRWRPDRAGNLPVLETPVTLEFRSLSRPEREIPVMVREDGVHLAAGMEDGEVRMVSTRQSATDAPKSPQTESNNGWRVPVPPEEEAQELARQLIQPEDVPTTLASLVDYFSTGGFAYSASPGRMRSGDVWEFLLRGKEGFCEHFAAGAANLLFLGGVPARVVTGYRGGEWNPWRKTITVRDSDAHAWVEAWDPVSQQWLRFDPSLYVAPDLTLRLNREMDPSLWPFHRMALRWTHAFLLQVSGQSGEWLSRRIGEMLPSRNALWFFSLAPLALLIWFGFRFFLRRSDQVCQQRRILYRLERRCAGTSRQRMPGETPLAWLSRLQDGFPTTSEEQSCLQQFTCEYEMAVYGFSPATGKTGTGKELDRLLGRKKVTAPLAREE